MNFHVLLPELRNIGSIEDCPVENCRSIDISDISLSPVFARLIRGVVILPDCKTLSGILIESGDDQSLTMTPNSCEMVFCKPLILRYSTTIVIGYNPFCAFGETYVGKDKDNFSLVSK